MGLPRRDLLRARRRPRALPRRRHRAARRPRRLGPACPTPRCDRPRGRVRRVARRRRPAGLGGDAADLRAPARSSPPASRRSRCLNAIVDRRAGPRRRRRRPDRQHRTRRSRASHLLSSEEPGGRADPLRHPRARHGLALMNGMALHGGVLPVGGTFFVFSDYMRPAVRLAALSQAKVIFSWTHDSVGVGEDGPTHQPIEHVASLRPIPDLRVIRPADANETAGAWRPSSTARRPDRADPHPPEPAGARGHRRTAIEGVAQRRLRRCTTPRIRRDRAVGTGSEVRPWPSAPPSPSPRTACPPGSCRCPAGSSSRPQDDAYRSSVLPAGVPTLVRRGRRHASAGTAGPTTPSASTASVPRPPATSCSSKLGFTADHVAERARGLL